MRRSLLVIMLAFLAFFPILSVSAVGEGGKVVLTEEKKAGIVKNCETVRAKLREVQKEDSKARVYLGKYYEIVLKNFMTPFNVRLVENLMSNAELVENQNEMTDAKSLFTYDFVNYQRELEELIAMDCKGEPGKFYEKLEVVRAKRKIVEQDTVKMKTLIAGHLKLAEGLRGKLK